MFKIILWNRTTNLISLIEKRNYRIIFILVVSFEAIDTLKLSKKKTQSQFRIKTKSEITLFSKCTCIASEAKVC